VLRCNIPNEIRKENHIVVALAAMPARHRGQKRFTSDNHQHTLKVMDFDNSNFGLRNLSKFLGF